ncbi:glycosyltransferase [[Eubacterium] cellulosolvens]
MVNALRKYQKLVGRGDVNEIISLAKTLGPLKIHHINSTRVGGGVAEILNCTIPIYESLGFDVTWDVIQGNKEFFEITKKFHNVLHGENIPITSRMTDRYLHTAEVNANILRDDVDFLIVHDPQPLPLIEYKKKSKTKCIWRCHIDATMGDRRLIGFLRKYVDKYDCAMYHLPNYTFGSFTDEYIVAPAIDPFNDKNRQLTLTEIKSEMDKYDIDPLIPIVLQVSRFDKLKDPIGVIKAFRLVQEMGTDAQLILAGGAAADDPWGEKVLDKVLKKAKGNPAIKILHSPPDITINALQRVASVVVQKSIREGFGLVVTEAMWKGKPVVGGNVGGIRRQIIHGENGFLVDTVEGTALRIQQLLSNPMLAKKMGNEARQTVLTNYLVPALVRNWLLLFLSCKHRGKKGVIHL